VCEGRLEKLLVVWSKTLVLMFQMRWFVCGFTFLDVSFTFVKRCML
jgi:hypothetical protein